MNHEEAAQLLIPYLDGELDLSTCLRLEKHLTECPQCAGALDQERETLELIRTNLPRPEAPPSLRARIRVDLKKQGVPSRPHSEAWWRIVFSPWAASGLATAAMAVLALVMFSLAGNSALEREAISNHVRSLQASHLMDIASTDRHTVKPWFAGKLDFSPQVIDLAPSGFPLVGGRLDVLDHRNVAALVYQRRKHYINLFEWPGTGKTLPSHYHRDGYHTLGWTTGGMNYLAVSEIGESELADFSQKIRAQTAGAPKE